jgi:hypothetical protein
LILYRFDLISIYRLATFEDAFAMMFETVAVFEPIAFVVRIASAVARPPMFATIARIDDAFGARLRVALTVLARIAMLTRIESERAMMEWATFDCQDFGGAMIFTTSDQRTMIVTAARFGDAEAFLARTQMTGYGVAWIGDASILLAWASVARTMMTFGQTTFADATRIVTTEGFTAFAFQTRTAATIVSVVPSVFASFGWSR